MLYFIIYNIFKDNLNVKGIIITTKGGIENFENYDFISRYFAPWLGIPEDPVTGDFLSF